MDLHCSEDHSTSTTLATAAVDAAVTLDTDEIIEILLRVVENESAYPRPIDYLATVQTHGMDALWRRRVCDWMVNTRRIFDLSADTVACAVHLMDRYLCVLSVDKIVLQLVSVICLSIASKVHENRPITMEEIDLLCQGKYPRQEMIKMEMRILDVAAWKLNPPTAVGIARDLLALELSSSLGVCLTEIETMVTHLLDACLSEYVLVSALESVKALAALEAVYLTQLHIASPVVQYALDELRFPMDLFDECVQVMVAVSQKLFFPNESPLEAASGKRHAPTQRSPTPTGVDTPPHLLAAQSPISHVHKKARHS
ncbi:hypothetical protein H310_14526 [Aphanomyces invadans]|uniref:Cyclin-like domain-containing protein n=1 Tax=Aphanomyces invadans TaxID=157072 RepID=A0A024TBJ7_9STRA|nr:hypothetical protein H310_14526 [Aphanomyces invadans]ETV90737.1 hypothetical protein H310_14526 [Aphanomyces invadans]RHY29011.1 hypothetical protein DYB32_005532 [Aphanomyces invadans]|eukprot:XP_008880627.1 hypothetical protein H310_14526 [Aphanomyces invadans]